MPRTELAPKRVLVICHGNICRSPFAHAFIQRADFCEVRQGGFREEGRRSPPKIREYAKRVGIDLDEHRSRRFDAEDCKWADIILYMDAGNLKNLREQFGYYIKGKDRALAAWIGQKRVPDPNWARPKSEEFLSSMSTLRDATNAFCAAKGVLK